MNNKVKKALLAIKYRRMYLIISDRYIFVNKLIYYGNDLMIVGIERGIECKVEEYGKIWRLRK